MLSPPGAWAVEKFVIIFVVRLDWILSYVNGLDLAVTMPKRG
jgi:hypothetical protein